MFNKGVWLSYFPSFQHRGIVGSAVPILFAGTAHHFQGSDLHISMLRVLFPSYQHLPILGFFFHVMHRDVRDDAFDSYRVSQVLSQDSLVAFQVRSATVFAIIPLCYVPGPNSL
jgi:hypothetical protein